MPFGMSILLPKPMGKISYAVNNVVMLNIVDKFGY